MPFYRLIPHSNMGECTTEIIKHIDVLEGAGLVARRRAGRNVRCSLVTDLPQRKSLHPAA